MALSPVEQLGFVSTIESAPGVAGTLWSVEEPDNVTKFGAAFKAVSSEPISPDRSDRAPALVDLDADVEYTSEMKVQEVHDHGPEMVMGKWQGGPTGVPEWSQTLGNLTAIANATDITVTAGGAISPAQGAMLLYGRNWLNAANNGVLVGAASSTGPTIKSAGLVAETPAAGQGASIELCGYKGAADDIVMTAGGNLTSTLIDFTTIGLKAGEWIWIGGETTATKFVNAGNRGLARVKTIAAHQITLEKRNGTYVNETTTGVTLYLYFGPIAFNVATTSASFLAQTRTFEAAYAQLAKPYSYATAQMLDTSSFSQPAQAKGEIKYAWKGFDVQTAVASGSRKSGAATASARSMTALINTTTSYMRLRVANHDETGALTDVQTLDVTIANNVKPVKVQNNLGPKYVNYGRFKVTAKVHMLMIDETIIAAARGNLQMSLDYTFRTVDGAFTVDLPSVQFATAMPNFPRNEPIGVDMDLNAYKDPTLGFVVGLSYFPYMPAA